MENEKRLIDVNVLVKDLEFLAKYEDSFRQSVILGVVQTVKAQPTVDAVEVVRCRDCTHLDSETGFCNLHSNYSKNALYSDLFDEDDFCSNGERKDCDD